MRSRYEAVIGSFLGETGARLATARWGSAAATIERVLKDAGESASRAAISKFLGHGRAHPSWRLSRTTVVVLVQAGRLGIDDTHRYELPLPPSLAGVAAERRLALTLAWLTSINPRHRAYRTAALDLLRRRMRHRLR